MSKSTDRIIAGSIQIFRDKGFNGASVNDIASAVGLLKGSLYSHFASKEEILLEVIKNVEQHFFSSIEIESSQNFIHILEKTAEFFIQQESCLMANLLSESLPETPRQQLIGFFLTWKRLLKESLDAKIAGNVREKFAENVISQFEGNVLMMKVVGSSEPVTDCLKKLTAEYQNLIQNAEGK